MPMVWGGFIGRVGGMVRCRHDRRPNADVSAVVVIELGEAAASRTQARGFFVGLSCMPSQTSNFRKEASVGARRGGGWEALGAIKRASSGPDRHGHTGQEDPDRGGSRW